MRGLIHKYTLLLPLLTLLTLGVLGQSSSSKVAQQQRKIAQLERQVAQGEKELQSIRKSRTNTEQRVRTLARQVESRNRLLTEQQTQVDLLTAQINQSDSQATKLQQSLEMEQKFYEQMAREAWRNYRHNNFLSYLFTSKNFTDMARRFVNLRSVANMRVTHMNRIGELSEEVKQHREQLSEQKASLDSVINNLQIQKKNLQRDITTARSEVKQMSRKEQEAMQQRNLQQRQLDSAISELRKLTKGNREGASFSSKTSNLRLPVVGGRVKRYRENMAEVTGAKGSKVIAIYEGKVVDIRRNRITNHYDVYIAHGEYITSYAGLSSVSVSKDSKVARNGTIGVIGSSVDLMTMTTEYKIVFGIYPPSSSKKMLASECFKK